MKLGNVDKKSLTVEDLEKPNLEFAVQFLQLVEADEGKLFWNGSYDGSQVKLTGRQCSLIKPAICVQLPEGMSNYFYDKQFILDWGVQNTLCNQQQEQPSSSRVSSASAKKNKDAGKEKKTNATCVPAVPVPSQVCGLLKTV